PAGAGMPGQGRHIVRQLQQRDRAQKARFLDLVQACEWRTRGRGGRGPGEGALCTRPEAALLEGRRWKRAGGGALCTRPELPCQFRGEGGGMEEGPRCALHALRGCVAGGEAVEKGRCGGALHTPIGCLANFGGRRKGNGRGRRALC
uniref:Uncharacterized protein n=1 Tax=Naja naja TaxID=35670 RepID=A0A8C6XHD8_NAJNA